MKSEARKSLILMMSMVLLVIAQSAGAQTADVESSKRPVQLFDRVNESYGDFNILFEYMEENAWAGNNNLEVRVITTTIDAKNSRTNHLKFIKFEFDEASRSIIERVDILSERYEGGDLPKAEYRYSFAVKKEATPQSYNIKLRFEPPDRNLHQGDAKYSDITRPFTLNIGSRNGGLLKVSDSIGGKSEPIICTTGEPQDFSVALINSFPGYPVNIEKIEVLSRPGGIIRRIIGSNPEGEIKGNVITFNPPITIESAQQQLLYLRFDMAGISFRRLIDGFFDKSHKVEYVFTYNDGHGRRISDFIHSQELKLQPSALAWIISMLLGVLIGTGLKLLLEHSTPRTKKVVLTTVAIGVVGSFIVWVTRIQLFILDIRGSYDNPLAIFLIGLAAAMIGEALFDTFRDKWKRPDPPHASAAGS